MTDTGRVRQRLSAVQVVELAELLEDAPRRGGVIDQVLQAAAEGRQRGMTLVLADSAAARGGPGGHGPPRPDGHQVDAGIMSGSRR
jgi:hypothetical protein